MDIQLGRSKVVRRAYGIDEIALVPGGRTVDPDVTDTTWTLGGIERTIPIIASAMDGVVDVEMAVGLSKLGALGVLNLEGVQTRYDDPNPVLDRIAAINFGKKSTKSELSLQFSSHYKFSCLGMPKCGA